MFVIDRFRIAVVPTVFVFFFFGGGGANRLGIFQQTGEILQLGVISPYVGENIFSHVGRKCQCLPPCSL